MSYPRAGFGNLWPQLQEGKPPPPPPAKPEPPPHAFRPAEAGDRGYLIDTWLQTYRPHWLRAYGGPSYMRQLESVYWSQWGHVGLVEHLLDTCQTMVCTLPEGGPWMYGWLCRDPDRLHYLFVRDEFRGQGLGRALLKEMGLDFPILFVTHMTPEFSRGLGRDRQIRFVNPYRKAER